MLPAYECTGLMTGERTSRVYLVWSTRMVRPHSRGMGFDLLTMTSLSPSTLVLAIPRDVTPCNVCLKTGSTQEQYLRNLLRFFGSSS